MERDITPAFEEIERRISGRGPITFAEFMEVALYGPGGYYTSSLDKWGPEGDYLTNLDISSVFSTLMARAVHEMWQVLGRPEDFLLIEGGAGRGLLTEGILDSLRDRYPDLYRTIKAVLVERNPHLRRGGGEKLRWLDDIDCIGRGVTGCFISNELFDSFPVHRLVMRGTLKEIYVGLKDGRLCEIEGELSDPALESYFDALDIRLLEGQTAEVSLAAGDYIKRLGAVFKKGFVLTVDYGLPARELYLPERRGTLLCHRRHTLNEDFFESVGRQDITAHVDFTTLVLEGRKVGLELTGFTLQRHFLMGLGILDELIEVSGTGIGEMDDIRHNQGIRELFIPGGMGDTFKVLVQHKGMEKPVLSGFSFRDMSGYLFR